MIVEHLFGVQIVGIRYKLLELCLMKKKTERRKKKKNKFKTLAFDFLDCEEKSWDSGAMFNIIIAKGFHL